MDDTDSVDSMQSMENTDTNNNMTIHNKRIVGVGLDDKAIHLLYVLLAGIPIKDKTEAQRQALQEAANELEAKKRVQVINRKALERELRTTLEAIGQASRDFIQNYALGGSENDDQVNEVEEDDTRKRKREQLEALEEQFGNLDQLRARLRLSMNDDDKDAQQLGIEARQTLEAEKQSVVAGAVPAMERRVMRSSSTPALHLPVMMQPTSPDPPDDPESATLSMPSPLTEFMDFTLLFGGGDGNVAHTNEAQLSYGDGNGTERRDIYRVATQSEQIDSVDDDDGLSRTMSRGSDASSAHDPQQQ
ncbi:hypothetical protein LTR84_002525 [Exophiala bonariae]|uniref:Uncharacterized protein n=1 Tax=Exophiala bonariae TaxID=1690606 RepID=A0AAV9N9V9_9EURO|nr:hypothetical protein LTR84_002525 [Exophiala bonariae]